MRDVFLVRAVRLPTGKFLGSLKDFSATRLGAFAVRAAVEGHIDPAAIDECIMGNVLGAGLGQNPARQAALRGTLPDTVAALTINKVCGSGLKAVMLASQAIQAGDIDAAVAGGMESMSNAPYLLPRVREGLRMGDGKVVDSMIRDGLWCAFEDWHMGKAAEYIASTHGVSRADQDAFAADSHHKAARAAAAHRFDDEIVATPGLAADETIRPDTNAEVLAKLKPAFAEGGTVTAGNAPGVSDGAAALVVAAGDRLPALGARPMARIVAQATSGTEPKNLLMTPVESVRKVIAKAGWKIGDVDLFEINEAFAAQMVAILRELALDPAKVNVNGGAIALGHPIGASGARILTTLVHEMRRRKAQRGVAALCLGGGNGVALAIEGV